MIDLDAWVEDCNHNSNRNDDGYRVEAQDVEEFDQVIQ